MAPSLVGSNDNDDDCVVGPGGMVVCHTPLRPTAGRRLLITQTPPGNVPVGTQTPPGNYRWELRLLRASCQWGT